MPSAPPSSPPAPRTVLITGAGKRLGREIALTLARANAFAGAICRISGAVPADISFYTPWIQSWGAAS